MQDAKALSKIIGYIYEASYKLEAWPNVLEKVTKFIGAYSTALLYKNKGSESQGCLCSYNFPAEDLENFIEFGVDPNFYLFSERVPVGTSAALDLLIPDREELEAKLGEKYCKMSAPTVFYHIGGSLLFEDEDRIYGIGIMRPKEIGPFTEENVAKLDLLVPHLQRAMIIHNEFNRLKAREKALQASLNRLLVGLILFNKQLKPIYINPVARSILKYHPAIGLEHGTIAASEFSDTEKIHNALINAISSTDTSHHDDSVTALGLKHNDCATTLPVIISPVEDIPASFEIEEKGAIASMYFSDPERTYPVEADKLAEIYGLTKAESQVAISMANGLSPTEVAEINDVAISTIRSQLKAIYNKVGVKSQAELVKTLLTGPFSNNH